VKSRLVGIGPRAMGAALSEMLNVIEFQDEVRREKVLARLGH
jgi:hypothetical protein